VRPALVEAVVFGGLSGAVFLALGAAFYRLYGAGFLQEAFLHHLSRRDPRHCFSAHWYHVYLSFLDPWPAGGAAAAEQGLAGLPASWPALPSGGTACTDGKGSAAAALAAAGMLDPERFALLPQAAALLALALALHRDLPFCWLLQTITFVAFNKVSTAQYFVWWFALLPAALSGLRWPPPRSLVFALGGWVAAQLHWLLWGYLLEFDGRQAHLALWGASVLFLAANAWLVVALLGAWVPPRTFLAVCLAMDREAADKKV
jgi:GPI mannosyltransferase 1 subunit M